MTRYGYILLDEHDPDISRQALQLDSIGGFKRIFVDRHLNKRPRWEQRRRLLECLQAGDVVYAAAADRICSNLDDFLSCLAHIDDRGAALFLLEEQLDSRSACGRQTIRTLGAFSALNFKDQSRRKKEGIRRAQAAGRRIGRPPVSIPPGFRDLCKDWEQGLISTQEAMAKSGLKSTSFYKKASELGFVAPGKKRKKQEPG